MPLPSPFGSENRDRTLAELFDGHSDDFELHEGDGEYTLTVDLPGFEREEIDVRWYDDRLRITAETTQVGESRRRQRRYDRTFQFPKSVAEEGIEATYRNGILELRLPIETDGVDRGRSIDVEGT